MPWNCPIRLRIEAALPPSITRAAQRDLKTHSYFPLLAPVGREWKLPDGTAQQTPQVWLWLTRANPRTRGRFCPANNLQNSVNRGARVGVAVLRPFRKIFGPSG